MSTHVNPYRATTIGDLITPSQLYWINIAVESVAVDKVEQSALMFDCSLYELNKEAANSLLSYSPESRLTMRWGTITSMNAPHALTLSTAINRCATRRLDATATVVPSGRSAKSTKG